MLLGKRFDRRTFIRQPFHQGLSPGSPCFGETQFARYHPGAIDRGSFPTHFARIVRETRHDLLQDKMRGDLTVIISQNRKGEIRLRIATRLYQFSEDSCELLRATGECVAKKATSSELKQSPVTSKPGQSLTDCELSVFREHLFQTIEPERHSFVSAFISVLLRIAGEARTKIVPDRLQVAVGEQNQDALYLVIHLADIAQVAKELRRSFRSEFLVKLYGLWQKPRFGDPPHLFAVIQERQSVAQESIRVFDPLRPIVLKGEQ